MIGKMIDEARIWCCEVGIEMIGIGIGSGTQKNTWRIYGRTCRYGINPVSGPSTRVHVNHAAFTEIVFQRLFADTVSFPRDPGRMSVTVQAPQPPSPQPIFVPLSPSVSRR